MNVSQYAPDKRMEREAIGSMDALLSVRESLQESSSGGEGGRWPAEPFVRTGVLQLPGASVEYGVDDRGRAHALGAVLEEGVCEMALPAEADGVPFAVVGPHAFSTCYTLEHIGLPETVEEIREHAFMNTALADFCAPAALRAIGAKAFFQCEKLESAELNDGLLELGEGAFRKSGLKHLLVPASVRSIGFDAFKDTQLVFGGDGATFEMDGDNGRYGLLGGMLYRAERDGLCLQQALSDDVEEYEGAPGLAHVGATALAGLRRLRRVTLPEGVLDIGDGAFRGCTALERVDLPDSLRSIGRRAFGGTALRELRIPASLQHAGSEAFYTGGSVARQFHPTIRDVSVAPGNDRFFLENDTLCQRLEGGGALALLYFGTGEHVTVPRSVTRIGPYAYLNNAQAKSICVHDGLQGIDVGGLDFGRALTTVIYEVGGAHPKRYVIEYPPGEAGSQTIRITFAQGNFDIDFAYAECDRAILHTRDVFVRSRMMVERLQNPVRMTGKARDLFGRRLAAILPSVVVEFGRNGYLRGIDALLDLGLLTEGNVREALDAAMAADEVAAVSRLLEIQRTAFALPLIDLEI